MSWYAFLAVVLVTVVAMEGAAWASHKYIMHGWGWGWHRSHHEPRQGRVEKNDLFAVVFAALAIVLIAHGRAHAPVLAAIGAGMTLYGLLYFCVHDGMVHQRWPWRFVPRSGYLKRLYQAHRLHHAVPTREGCVAFSFLYAPPVDRLRDELRRLDSARRSRAS